jgi:hypothetical protein
VRIVLEEDAPPTRDEVIRFLDEAMPRLDRGGPPMAGGISPVPEETSDPPIALKKRFLPQHSR